MATHRKLGLNVPVEIAERLKALSASTMIPQSKLLGRALELLFESYDSSEKQKTRKQSPP